MTKKYVFLGSLRIAQISSEEGIHFYHSDHLGSSNVITDKIGNLVQTLEYEPFGAVTQNQKAGGSSLDVTPKFTGYTEDIETSLYFAQARYYDAELGQFTQADPIIQDPTDPQTFNRYAYARNNPIKFVDPSGFGFSDFIKGWTRDLIPRVVGAFTFAVVFLATFGNVALATAAGFSAYRATQTALAGGTVGQIIVAGIRGFIEGYQIGSGFGGPSGSSVTVEEGAFGSGDTVTAEGTQGSPEEGGVFSMLLDFGLSETSARIEDEIFEALAEGIDQALGTNTTGTNPVYGDSIWENTWLNIYQNPPVVGISHTVVGQTVSYSTAGVDYSINPTLLGVSLDLISQAPKTDLEIGGGIGRHAGIGTYPLEPGINPLSIHFGISVGSPVYFSWRLLKVDPESNSASGTLYDLVWE